MLSMLAMLAMLAKFTLFTLMNNREFTWVGLRTWEGFYYRGGIFGLIIKAASWLVAPHAK